jgi:hypothetical protein
MADFDWSKYAVNPGGSGIHVDENGRLVDARGNPVNVEGSGQNPAYRDDGTMVSHDPYWAVNGNPAGAGGYQTGYGNDGMVVRGMENQPKSTVDPNQAAYMRYLMANPRTGVDPGFNAQPNTMTFEQFMAQQGQQQGGDFPSRIRATIKQSHPDWTEAQVANQVQYYVNKNNDPNDRSAWATGEPGRTMEDYWIGRENGSISPDGGPGGGYGGYGGGLSAEGFSPNAVSRTASFNAPGLLAPWTGSYQAPNLTDDPGFQFRLQEGQKALERSAASKGTLLTGGTLKDLAGFSQGLASQEYGAADARAFRNYGNDQNAFWTNQNNAFNKLNPMVGYGLQAAGQGINAAGQTAQYATQYGRDQANLATGAGNNAAAGTIADSNANSSIYNTLGNIDWGSIFNRGGGGAKTASPGMGG